MDIIANPLILVTFVNRENGTWWEQNEIQYRSKQMDDTHEGVRCISGLVRNEDGKTNEAKH